MLTDERDIYIAGTAPRSSLDRREHARLLSLAQKRVSDATRPERALARAASKQLSADLLHVTPATRVNLRQVHPATLVRRRVHDNFAAAAPHDPSFQTVISTRVDPAICTDG